MCQQKTSMFKLVEIVWPGKTGGNKATHITLDDQPYLRYKVIERLEVYTNADVSKSPQNNDVFTATELTSAYLSLYTMDTKQLTSEGLWLSQIPIITLHNMQNATDPFSRTPMMLTPTTVIWEKSFIDLGEALDNTTAKSILIGVYFQSTQVINGHYVEKGQSGYIS